MSDPTPGGHLAAQAKLLGAQVSALTEAVGDLDNRANRSRRVLTMAVAGLVLDLVLSVGLVFTLTEQTRTRDQALCPMFALFVGSYRPDSRAEGEDRERYEAAFVTLREAYAALDCTARPVPPPAPR